MGRLTYRALLSTASRAAGPPAGVVPVATTQLTPKQQANGLLKQLPDNAIGDALVYELAVRRSIERGLADADAGRLTDIKDIRREFGLAE